MFTIETRLPHGTSDPLANRCDFVFAHDLLGDRSAGALRSLANLAALTRMGGTIELFGETETDALLDEIVQECGTMGLGIATAARADAWRLSLQRLSGPV